MVFSLGFNYVFAVEWFQIYFHSDLAFFFPPEILAQTSKSLYLFFFLIVTEQVGVSA